ncbi:MAG: hypothetical protein M1816_005323 [Peltula sp. TS41687]|nr:MAG: hypothetical protein M1816_005323 [Peltula sp. TS41687]
MAAAKVEEEGNHDPTLPQHRPSIRINTNRTASIPPQPSSSSSSAGAKRTRYPPPDEGRLANLAQLDEFEKEIKTRGGPGRINFQEFHNVMSSPVLGARLQFLGSWIEMATF